MTRSFLKPKSFNIKSLLPGGPKNKDKVAQMEAGTELSDPKVEEEKVYIDHNLFQIAIYNIINKYILFPATTIKT